MLVLLRSILLLVSYSGTVVFSLWLGAFLWPEGIGNEAEIIFWPATGIALYFVLRFGPGYAPVMLLSILPAVLFAEDPQVQAFLGALGNVFEVLVGWWILTRLGRYKGQFESIRVVAAFALASVVGGIASALYPMYQFAGGHATGETLSGTMMRFAFANGCGTMIVCYFLTSITSGRWHVRQHRNEFILWLGALLLVISTAFNAVFNQEINYAFLVFPLVIYAAIRFGPAECSTALMLVVAGIYWSLYRFGTQMEEEQVVSIIRFVQAFTWVLAVTGLFVVALVAERRQAQQDAMEAETLLLQTELKVQRARLEALRYQINPHFLFNSINSICASLPDNQGNGRTMLAELAHYLRSLLDHPAEDLVPLEHELESVRRYVAVEMQRYGDMLSCEIHAPQQLMKHRIPVFVLQPLVENAIRHGFRSNRESVRIDVSAERDTDGHIVLTVVNTGRWMEQGAAKGLGLANIRKRLHLLFGDRASIQHEQTHDAVNVKVTVPPSSTLPSPEIT